MTTLTEIGVPHSQIADRNDWNDEGVIILPGFYDTPEGNALMERYSACWVLNNARRPGGWPDPTPYMRHSEILDLVAPIAEEFETHLGSPYGLHLNLTGWVSTQRDWHQDSYLNPPNVGDKYVAIWLALDDIDPESGPFQYVPGSHFWPQVTRAKIWELLDGYAEADWPSKSESVLTQVFEEEIKSRQAEVITYLPKRGDLLMWHGRLCHRGSRPIVPGLRRQAFISHFSAVDARPDMAAPRQHSTGGWFFPFDNTTGDQ
jgi:ectoine hydroxylase-related dioxygenase (phytanoyl-CoA dioxygenase family)